MGHKISWSVDAAVEDGPRLKASQTVEVGAYDKVKGVVVKKDQGTNQPGSTTLEVQPSAQTDAIRFFSITSDRYGKDLVFTVMNGGVADAALEGPLVVVGEGIGALLQKAPKKLKFTNGMDHDATIEVMVGRDAVT